LASVAVRLLVGEVHVGLRLMDLRRRLLLRRLELLQLRLGLRQLGVEIRRRDAHHQVAFLDPAADVDEPLADIAGGARLDGRAVEGQGLGDEHQLHRSGLEPRLADADGRDEVVDLLLRGGGFGISPPVAHAAPADQQAQRQERHDEHAARRHQRCHARRLALPRLSARLIIPAHM
jgi:hypothetical protein